MAAKTYYTQKGNLIHYLDVRSVYQLLFSAWLHVKQLQSTNARQSQNKNVNIGVNPQGDDKYRVLEGAQLEEFKYKVAVKLADYEEDSSISEIVVVHFYNAISSIWSKSCILKQLKDAEIIPSLKYISSEVAYSLIPLLTYSKQQSANICCSGCMCGTESKREMSEKCQCQCSSKKNKFKMLLPTIDQRERICWATTDVVAALYTAIDKSLRMSKTTWQCIEDFAVAVVEIDHDQVHQLFATSKTVKLPASEECRIKTFRLMVPDPKFYSALFDVFLTMNASSLVSFS